MILQSVHPPSPFFALRCPFLPQEHWPRHKKPCKAHVVAAVAQAKLEREAELLSEAQLQSVLIDKKAQKKKEEDENKERIWMEQQGGLFTLKMWVPREQGPHFPGQT